ncbi:primosomal protein N' [Peribacillus acanthi]|uniref:primosomal protein N' n=1 Tax=Peribacillus acanthi TaxID=2171554 RepID=UPI000D3EB19A|nr:primosomal protein N' [Peribacillus acanthi]
MNIAKVIVDVPAKQIDREFDYLIPNKWLGMILPGMRVAVPFGPRTIQGFVTRITDQSSFDNLKPIQELLDIEPVLNQELMDLADWLTDETLCYRISAYQVMLPAALKAKYRKKLRLAEPESLPHLHPKIKQSFSNKTELDWQDVMNHESAKIFLSEVKNGTLRVHYEVKNQLNKKTVRFVQPNILKDELEEQLKQLSKNAIKQRSVLQHFIFESRSIIQSELLSKTGATSSTINSLVEKGILSIKESEVYRDPYENREFIKSKPFPLTSEQSTAIGPIKECIAKDKHDIFLLYGVTGSGKTEVYLQSIDDVLAKGEQAIMLVPEISLTPQMVKRFKERFGNAVAVLHSGLSVGEKYDEWRKIYRDEVSVVVGARSAIFAPFRKLGLIIIDEEHESSYKQEDHPRYHARDVAIQRGLTHKCPVILGSATPTLETFARAKKGRYQLLSLTKRMNQQALPSVKIVDMREELRSGNRSVFSTDLLTKIKDRIEKKEQIVLFLNKRGHSSFVMCRSCGAVSNCPNCDISLTYHKSSHQLKCHYCAYEEVMPTQCPDCQSEAIRYFGTGTQKVEEELAKIIPEARVIRMDVDTTSRKGSHERLLQAFQDGQADILLGTQMIAKGLDFPNITLVGVLSADTMLHLPDFRSSEKTFQLLTQVSGRAGRHHLPGEVIIQTYTPEHYSIILASMQDYDQFFGQEMMIRRQNMYPPYYYLALVTISHEDLMKTVSVTEHITHHLKNHLSQQSVILGPVASPIPRINNRYRYQCLVKYKQEPALKNSLKKLLDHYQQDMATRGLQIMVDLNPQIMM